MKQAFPRDLAFFFLLSLQLSCNNSNGNAYYVAYNMAAVLLFWNTNMATVT